MLNKAHILYVSHFDYVDVRLGLFHHYWRDWHTLAFVFSMNKSCVFRISLKQHKFSLIKQNVSQTADRLMHNYTSVPHNIKAICLILCAALMDRGGYARAHLVLDLHSCKVRAVLLSELFLQRGRAHYCWRRLLPLGSAICY